MNIEYWYRNYKMMHTIQADEQSFITARPSLLKLQIDALIHYQPFANKKMVAFEFGYDFFSQFKIKMTSPIGVYINNLQITSENFGSVDFGIKWNNLLPFVGLNLQKSVFRKKVMLGLNLGGYLIGKPKLGISYDGFLETI